MARLHSSVGFAWKCPSCSVGNSIIIRSFTSSISHRKTGPESPRYIDIPEPPQKTFTPRPRIKGVLPVPRDIFQKRHGGVGKVTADYLAAATQQANPVAAPTSDAERTRNEYKERMAERRKQNLREGLTELQNRRRKRDDVVAHRTAAKIAHRAQLIAAPAREDDRLTKPTTTMLMKSLQHRAVLPDPDRAKRIAAMTARVEAKEAQRAGETQDALHTLYLHARNFITTEAHLDEMIEQEFGSATQPRTFNGGNSIWKTHVPESIQDKLNAANKTRGTLKDSDWVPRATRNRIGTIAEQLTGGKMEVD